MEIGLRLRLDTIVTLNPHTHFSATSRQAGIFKQQQQIQHYISYCCPIFDQTLKLGFRINNNNKTNIILKGAQKEYPICKFTGWYQLIHAQFVMNFFFAHAISVDILSIKSFESCIISFR